MIKFMHLVLAIEGDEKDMPKMADLKIMDEVCCVHAESLAKEIRGLGALSIRAVAMREVPRVSRRMYPESSKMTVLGTYYG